MEGVKKGARLSVSSWRNEVSGMESRELFHNNKQSEREVKGKIMNFLTIL